VSVINCFFTIFLTPEGRIATLHRQMPVEIPHLVEPHKLVDLNQQLSDSLPLTDLPRITEFFGPQKGKIEYSLDCEKDEAGSLFLNLSIKSVVLLTCQRTMELFEYPVARETILQLAPGEEEARSLPEEIEPIFLDENRLNLIELLEDELMLAIPIVPINEIGENAEKVEVAEKITKQDTHKPFAGLGELMQKAKQDK